MTQSAGFSNSFVIDSKQIFNKIEADLIRLSQVLQVEYKYSIEAAMQVIAVFLLTKYSELTNNDNITVMVKEIRADIFKRSKTHKVNELDSTILKLLSELGL